MFIIILRQNIKWDTKKRRSKSTAAAAPSFKRLQSFFF